MHHCKYKRLSQCLNFGWQLWFTHLTIQPIPRNLHDCSFKLYWIAVPGVELWGRRVKTKKPIVKEECPLRLVAIQPVQPSLPSTNTKFEDTIVQCCNSTSATQSTNWSSSTICTLGNCCHRIGSSPIVARKKLLPPLDWTHDSKHTTTITSPC